MESVNTTGIKWHIISKVENDTIFVRGISTLLSASSCDISFFSNYRYLNDIYKTQACVVIIEEKFYKHVENIESKNIQCFIISDNAYLLYTRIAQWFNNFISNICMMGRNIDRTSIISTQVNIGKNVVIGPYCVIEENVEIGDNSIIGAFSLIGSGVKIGSNCRFFPRVTLYKNVCIGNNNIFHSGVVIGSDGFGYAQDHSGNNFSWSKIPHFGTVLIGNNVEIGANTTIDRGSLDSTVISDGVKIDNQVMIGHNVTVNESTAIAACVGIAGSTMIGKRCIIGGAAMISGHLNIVDDVHIAGGTAVISNITKAGRYAGVYPYSSHIEWQKNAPIISHLAKLRKMIMFPHSNN
ncbi:UDP-3-O-[3-hydroxymyristoyl] glucosamine N-acyltransferase [Candidatus Kinetoplastibacterium crithidii (ex Angomonas deanei ATCC 30255)]|nr:UDP-3-O-[3-hydroxymyristoyl] glucosamine N-acyltransferase [Candidatus Kinetoplastibacterium crithidii (ex Angomonas deanei ATCC 30255)]